MKPHQDIDYSVVIRSMLPTSSASLKDQFLLWAFDTLEPNFNQFPLLYNKCPDVNRGKYKLAFRHFTKSQELYISECFVDWLLKQEEA